MYNNTAIENQTNESSRIYTLFYSFFLIPFMIAIFGALFFLLFRFVTFETNDASALLNQVKVGSASKRWQSAFELSKVFNNPDRIPSDASFKNQMVSIYNHSIHDDHLVRAYLALAMGMTRDEFYSDVLLKGLHDENLESRLAAVQAVGMIGAYNAEKRLKQIVKNSDYLKHILQENKKVRRMGITSAPTLLLNGKTIFSKSRKVECINEFFIMRK